MDIYSKKSYWKIGLLSIAAILIAASLYYNNRVAQNLAEEEGKKAKQFAMAFKDLGKRAPALTSKKDSLSFNRWYETGLLSEIIQSNTTIPVIITNEEGKIINYRNLPEHHVTPLIERNDSTCIVDELNSMKAFGEPIVMSITKDTDHYIYRKESNLLRQLRWYPYIQLGLLTAFLLVAYWAFNTARRAEQNKVWLGMAKETAHQLGTPLTSLVGWVELMKISDDDNTQMIGGEIDKDVNRLSLISERFSKIGSEPKLLPMDVADIVQKTVNYMRSRASKKVEVTYEMQGTQPINCKISPTLFDWVIENLMKNALDATGPAGKIDVQLIDKGNEVQIDVTDTGKGIPKGNFNSVFEPGFSTKKRGWGLGLSLSKRIVEYYHNGKIFVHQSTVGKGTTFRIILPK